MIRPAHINDGSALATIYNHYILHSPATFEVATIDAAEMVQRMKKVTKDFQLPWLVMEEAGQIIGYAYATQWKARKAYAKTTETSIYIHKDHGGKGYGKHLYSALLDAVSNLGYHVAIGGMSIPNPSSQALHEQLGFSYVGVFKDVGFKFDRWIDVGYWQLVL